ncbi:MAG: hypothetical protein Kow0068_12700 [Marinilabiliales bacterium]
MLATLISYSNLLYTQKINIDDAEKVAVNFYAKQSSSLFQTESKDVKTSGVIKIKNKNDDVLFYVFNIKNGGYIAVSAVKSSVPVLFYSFNGRYEDQGYNPAFYFWIDQYKKQINHSIINNEPADEFRLNQWNELLYNKGDFSEKSVKSIPPLVVTQWDQGPFYNAFCPADINGPDGHAYAGCVATAMGQLMFYHKWPKQGSGSYSYYHPVYDTLSADFGNTYYDWDAMPVQLLDYNDATALLLYHLGVSVTMDYGPNGSGMWNHSAALSLRNYFKYCNETEYVFRDSTVLDWDSIVIANLDAKKPLYYAGWADDSSFTSGHAFVCDGYQSPGYYHFNWGWSGSYDGFFYTDNLTPGGSQFTYAQEIIKDIYPDTILYQYPDGCSGLKTLTYSEGSLNDGSNGANYQPGLYCTYLIQPDCGSSFTVMFNKFFLASGDTLFVYDGVSENDVLLYAFTQNDLPVLANEISPTSITPVSGSVFLVFKTDSSAQDEGWDISWYSEYCDGTVTLTDSSGIINDGSGPCDYKNNSNCKWIIAPPNAGNIYINFTEFDLAPNTLDFVVLYRNSLSPSNIFAKFDYQNIPADTLIDEDTCVVFFKTNGNDVAGGFTLEYAGYPANNDIIENNRFDLIVYPNPSANDIYLKFNILKEQKIKIEILNSVFETIAAKEVLFNKGNVNYCISDLLTNVASGYYMVRLTNENTSVVKSFIYHRN